MRELRAEHRNYERTGTDNSGAFEIWISQQVTRFLKAKELLPPGYMPFTALSLLVLLGCFQINSKGLRVADLCGLTGSSTDTISRYVKMIEADGYASACDDAPLWFILTTKGWAALYAIWDGVTELY